MLNDIICINSAMTWSLVFWFLLKKWLFIHTTVLLIVETLQMDTSHRWTTAISRHLSQADTFSGQRWPLARGLTVLKKFYKTKISMPDSQKFTIQCTPAITVVQWELNKAMFNSDCLKDVHQPSNWFFCLVFLLEVIMCVQSHKKPCHQLLDC